MMKLKVKEAFPWDKIGSYRNANPYSIYFVYPQNEKPFIIKGGSKDCERFLKAHPNPAIYYYSFWHKGKHRGGWLTHKFFISISRYDSNYRLVNGYILSKGGQVIKRVRRIPRKWIKEYDNFVDG
jgi:hypothetical protein